MNGGVQVMPPRKPNRKTFPFVGSCFFAGIPIDIEQRKGDVREGVDRDGHKWRVKMHAHYGEVRAKGWPGAKGMDGDQLDVYVGPDATSDVVVVVDQLVPATGERDEQKVMLGFPTVADAVACYKRQYDDQRFYGGHIVMTVDRFKQKIANKESAGHALEKAFAALFKSGGPYIGPRGGKWANPQHTIPWKPERKAKPMERPLEWHEQLLAVDASGRMLVDGFTDMRVEATPANVHAIESKLRGQKVETAVILGGPRAFVRRGTSSSVHFMPDERADVLATPGVCVLTHNHPGDAPLSPQDVVMVIAADLAEMRAVTKHGVFWMRRPPGGWPPLDSGDPVVRSDGAPNLVVVRGGNTPNLVAKVGNYLDNVSSVATSVYRAKIGEERHREVAWSGLTAAEEAEYQQVFHHEAVRLLPKLQSDIGEDVVGFTPWADLEAAQMRKGDSDGGNELWGEDRGGDQIAGAGRGDSPGQRLAAAVRAVGAGGRDGSGGCCVGTVAGGRRVIKAGGPYIGPHGGLWADPQHAVHWEAPKPKRPKKGSAFGVLVEMDLPPDIRATVVTTVGKLLDRFPEVGPLRITEHSWDWALATKAKHQIYLSSKVREPGFLDAYAKELDGVVLNPSLEGVIVHEFGHILGSRALDLLGGKAYNKILKDHLSNLNSISSYESPSVYGQETTSEFEAEAFSAFWYRKPVFDNDLAVAGMNNGIAYWTAMLAAMRNKKPKRVAKGGEKPPEGFTPIAVSKHGGYHKFINGRWQTWYPDIGHEQHPHEFYSADEHEREHARPRSRPNAPQRLLRNPDGSLMTLYQANHAAKMHTSPDGGSEYGIYVTPLRRYAQQYGPNLHRAHVRLANPLIVEGKYEISPRDLTKSDVDALRSKGYDSIISLQNRDDPWGTASEIVLFDSGQVVDEGDMNAVWDAQSEDGRHVEPQPVAKALSVLFGLNKAGGPYIGPRGGKWANAAHTIAWSERSGRRHHRQRGQDKLTPGHRKARQRIEKHELRIRDSHVEHVIVAEGKGPLHIQEGEASHALMHRDDVDRWARRGDAVLTHNHPSGMCFSESDMRTAYHANLAEIRAVTGSGVWSFIRPSDGWARPYHFIAENNDRLVVSPAQRAMQNYVRDHGFNSDVWLDYLSHATHTKLHPALIEEFGDDVSYTRWPDRPGKNRVRKVEKGGPYIGPRGGKWADSQHTIPWKPSSAKLPSTPEPEPIRWSASGLLMGELQPGAASLSDVAKVLLQGTTDHERQELTLQWLHANWHKLQAVRTSEDLFRAFDGYDDHVDGVLRHQDEVRDQERVDKRHADVEQSQAHRKSNDPGRVTTPERGAAWAAGGALPTPIYHATLAGKAIMASGLKAREDLRGSDGRRVESLGGGPDNTVSTTPDLNGARKIAAMFAALAEAEKDPAAVKSWLDKNWLPLVPPGYESMLKEVEYADARPDPFFGVKARFNIISQIAGYTHPYVLVPVILAKPRVGALEDIGIVTAYAHVDAVMDDRGRIASGPGHDIQNGESDLRVMRPNQAGEVDHGVNVHRNHAHLKTAHVALASGNKAEQNEIRVAPEDTTAVGFERVTDWRAILSGKMAKGGVEKPPPGYAPIPNSKHGGFHKLSYGSWQTWYPGHGMGPHPHESFKSTEHADEHDEHIARSGGDAAHGDLAFGDGGVVRGPGQPERIGRRPGHIYRGMTEEEYQAHQKAGYIKSTGQYSHPSEGTNFADDFDTAEDYVNVGRDDPRKTGKPTYVVEVRRHHGDGMFQRWSADGYVKTPDKVPMSRVTRIWRMDAHGDAVVAVGVNPGHLAKGVSTGPYIGPRGGKWADPQHTVPWRQAKPPQPTRFGDSEFGGGKKVAVRDEASNRTFHDWRRDDHVYRGMSSSEYQSMMTSGEVRSPHGTTHFADSFDEAESYANYRDGGPSDSGTSYLAEVRRHPAMRDDPDGYVRAEAPVPFEHVSRLWEMSRDGRRYMARLVHDAERKRPEYAVADAIEHGVGMLSRPELERLASEYKPSAAWTGDEIAKLYQSLPSQGIGDLVSEMYPPRSDVPLVDRSARRSGQQLVALMGMGRDEVSSLMTRICGAPPGAEGEHYVSAIGSSIYVDSQFAGDGGSRTYVRTKFDRHLATIEVTNRYVAGVDGAGVRQLLTQAHALQELDALPFAADADPWEADPEPVRPGRWTVSLSQGSLAGSIDDPGYNGYYTWPQLGYTAPNKGPRGESLEQLMSSRAGAAWWRLRGGACEASFDPTPGSYSMRRLEFYARHRFGKAIAKGGDEMFALDAAFAAMLRQLYAERGDA